jgi:5-methylcytosine-specific restriction endonuclease McrA
MGVMTESRKAALRRYYLKHKEEQLERTRAYAAVHKQERRVWNRKTKHQRRAIRAVESLEYHERRRSAIGHYTEAQWQDRLAFYGFRCYLCGVDWFSLDSFDRTVDHVIPLSQGGTNWPANLRPACRSCNGGKCDKGIGISEVISDA